MPMTITENIKHLRKRLDWYHNGCSGLEGPYRKEDKISDLVGDLVIAVNLLERLVYIEPD